MPKRVSPTERVRAEIDELFGSGREIAEILEEAMRLSARLVLPCRGIVKTCGSAGPADHAAAS
jgi:hypothetical protein